MKINNITAICLLSFSLGALRAEATETLTFNGTVVSPAMGYSNGENISIAVTLNGAAYGSPSDYMPNTSTVEEWDEYTTGLYPLYSAVTITSATGVYALPSNPDNILTLTNNGTSDSLTFQVLQPGEYTGLFGPSTSAIYSIGSAGNLTLPAVFGFPDANIAPSTYFAGYNGSYAATGNLVFGPESGSSVFVSLSSVNISAGAVPEPATWGIILGSLALGFVAIRRQRSGAAA